MESFEVLNRYGEFTVATREKCHQKWDCIE